MSKSNTFEGNVLDYVFTAVAFPFNAATQLQIHLHTADPGEGGLSSTSPATYTGYAPVTVARATSAWTVTGNTVTNDNLITFPANTGASQTITHVSVTASGSTTILYSGSLVTPLLVSTGIQPQIQPGALTITED